MQSALPGAETPAASRQPSTTGNILASAEEGSSLERGSATASAKR
jgi:hypothetical protein